MEDALGAVNALLEVLNTSVEGAAMKKLVADHGLVGPSPDAYWGNPSAGLSVGTRNGVVTVIFLHALGKDDYAQFPGPLPAGLTFDARQPEVRQALGAPESSGAAGRRVFLPGGWDRFAIGAYFIHVTYREDGRIELVTLMPGARQA